MKRNRAVLLLILLMTVLAGCRPGRNRDLAEEVYQLEPGADQDAPEVPEKIREIQKDINHWEDELNDALTAAKNTGRFYRVLGMKYMEYDMFGPARDSFSRSLEFTPENARLYYYRGIAVSRVAMTRQDEGTRQQEMEMAEADYIRAIQVEPIFMPPYYSLAVLYIYELNRPFEADLYLEKYVSVERSEPRGHLLYGQLLEQMGRLEEALDHYNKVLSLSASDEEKEQVKEYIRRIKEDKW